MEDFEIDISAFEKQRYDSIKNSGKYLELNVLIGSETQNYEDSEGNIPVITTVMHGCKSTEISCLYITLKELIKHLEKEYPAECLYASLTMNCTHLEDFEKSIKKEDNDEDPSI